MKPTRKQTTVRLPEGLLADLHSEARRQGISVDDIMDAAGLRLLGIVPEDRRVALSATQGTLAQLPAKLSPAKAWKNIAHRLEGERTPILWR